MASDEENCSDEEILDNDWPDDYFDLEGDGFETNRTSPVFISDKTIYDLPPDCLRMVCEILQLHDRMSAAQVSTAFHEAVTTSKCIAGDKFVITADYKQQTNYLGDFKFYGAPWSPFGSDSYKSFLNHMAHLVPKSSQKLPKLCSYYVDYIDVSDQVVQSFAVSRGNGQDLFQNMRRHFDKIHLKQLILMNVSLEENLMKTFHSFIEDACTFDMLILKVDSPLLMTNRTLSLMAQAKKHVQIHLSHCDVTPSLVCPIDHPVTFKGLRWAITIKADLSGRPGDQQIADEDFFIELVRKGHNFEQLSAPLTSTERLAEVIEAVSSSLGSQKVDVTFGTGSMLQLIELYLADIDAERMFKQVLWSGGESDQWRGGYPSGEVRTFKHGRATIYLALNERLPVRARVVVTSKAYEA